jgi:ubiquinol-cytochrome c reductase subunit 7
MGYACNGKHSIAKVKKFILLSMLQDIEEALRRLPIEVVDARNQRLKRAMDLSMKHTSLPIEMQEKQTPFEPYLQEALAQVRAENAERYSLGTGAISDRTIP